MKFLVIFALALATSSAFETAVPFRDTLIDDIAEGRITNGQAASVGQFPYQVSILYTKTLVAYSCGGSIISANYVLTAAQCTHEVPLGTVYYGSTSRLFGPSVIYTNFNIIQHLGYNPATLENDVSLIHVTLNLGRNAAAIALPAGTLTYAGSYAIISGYGFTTDGGSYSNRLRYARSVIITNAVCSSAIETVGDSNICISTPNGVSTCTGDTGGPLALEESNTLVGVASYGSSNGCTAGFPAVFSRVTYFRDWINTNSGL